MELHDGHGLDSVGGILRMDDLVQAPLSLGNASDALPLRRCQLEVACADVRMVPLLVQRCYRYEGAAYSGSVQSSVEGELRLSVPVGHSDGQRPASDGREALLICGVQEDGGRQR